MLELDSNAKAKDHIMQDFQESKKHLLEYPQIEKLNQQKSTLATSLSSKIMKIERVSYSSYYFLVIRGPKIYEHTMF